MHLGDPPTGIPRGIGEEIDEDNIWMMIDPEVRAQARLEFLFSRQLWDTYTPSSAARSRSILPSTISAQAHSWRNRVAAWRNEIGRIRFARTGIG